MSVRVNKEKCVGCGKCTDICPGNLFGLSEGKAVMCYPKDCWGCVSCVKECPAHAIEFFLGADMGGNRSVMTVKEEPGVLHWIIEKPDHTVTEINIDRTSSNRY